MKKKWIKSVAIICAAALFAESFPGIGSLTVKAESSNDHLLGESNQFLDKGGYKTEPYGKVTISESLYEYIYRTSVTLQNPTKDGFTFEEWYRDEGFTRPVDEISDTESGDVMLYTKWMSENDATYTTQVFMQSPALRSYEKVAEEELTGVIGDEVTLEYEGDTTGFSLNEEKSVKTGTVLADGSLVLCLYYDRNKYNVTYHLDEGINAYGNADSYVYGVGMALITPSKDGHTFNGWYTDEACTDGNQVDIISDTDSGAKELWAKWSRTPDPEEPVEPDPGGDGDTNLPADSKFSFSYDADKKLVTVSAAYPDATMVICYIAKYTDEETAKKEYQNATNALPGITLAGHLGITLSQSDNGFSKEISEIPSVEEGDYIVFGFNISGQFSAETAWYYAKIGGTGGGGTGGDTSKTSYTVNHYKQNVTLESYELVDTETISDVEAGSEVTAVSRSYEGCTFDEEHSVVSGTVKGDGGLVLNLYYDRDSYSITYENMDGAANPNVSKYYYGEGLVFEDAVKEGYLFEGWYTDAEFAEDSRIERINEEYRSNLTVYAKWAQSSQTAYTVRYYKQNLTLDGYEEVEADRVSGEGSANSTVTAQIKDYAGFTCNEKAPGSVLQGTIPENGSLVLKVYYDRNHYKITYHNVTEEENAENQTEYVYGVGMKLAKPKLRDGSCFAGWYTSEDWASELQVVEIGSEQIGDIDLYARWVDESYVAKYTVEYYLQDTALEEYVKAARDTVTAYAVVGETVTAPGTTYMGFTRNKDVTESVESGVVTEDGSLVLKLYYDRNVYKIRYQNVEGAELTQENADHYVYGVGTALGTASREGYIFTGWYTDKNMTEASKVVSVSTDSTGDLTLYAGWTGGQAEYQVKYYLQNKSLDGYEEVVADEVFKKADTNITVEAEVKEYPGFTCNEKAPGSVFQGTVSEDGSLVLKVYYDRNKYGITYHNLEGTENAEENAAEYVYGVGVKLKTPSKEGYVFGGWYMDAACTEVNRIVEISETDIDAKDIYAKWISQDQAASYRAEYYLQNTTLDDYEHVDGEDYEGYGMIGESVNAPVKVFEGFTKNADAEGFVDSGVVTKDGSLVLKVYYDRNKYDIAYNNMEEAKNYNSEQYIYGVTLYLKDPTRKGYVFGGWYLDAEFRRKVTQIDAGRTGTVELYAKWTDKSELLWTVDDIKDQYYTGKKITPVVVVKDRETDRKLQLNKDYTVKYQNNLNAGTATVVITGKGNYTASKNITFKILPIDLSKDETVSAEDVYKYATGKAVKISPVVKWGTKKLKLNKDFRIDTSVEGSAAAYTAEGTYGVVLTGMGNYTGSVRIEAVLSNKSTIMISKVSVKGVVSQTYQQGKKEYTQNNLQVTYKGTPLQEDVHYSLQYRNNTQAGTAEIIIKGLSSNDSLKFTGTKTVKFKINGEKLKANNISFSQQSYVYSGEEIEPNVIVRNASGQIIQEDEAYTVKYSQNVDKGKGTVTVTGINAYTGSVKKTFNITSYSIQDAKVDISMKESVSFTKGGAQAAVTVTYNRELLSEGVDYTLKYSDNRKIGIGKVVITGKGNFTGRSEKSFNITAKELPAVSMIVSDVAYNQKKNMQYYLAKPVLMDAGSKLSAGKDYAKSMTYELLMKDGSYSRVDASSSVSQIEVGSVLRVTVTGTGDYTGNLSEVYRVIEPAKTIKGARISIVPQIYTGRAITLTEEDIVSVEVKSNGSYKVLEPDQYEIVPGSYKNNTKKGTARVTIKGIGEYGGCQEATFKIEAQDIEKTTIISRIMSWLRGYGRRNQTAEPEK